MCGELFGKYGSNFAIDPRGSDAVRVIDGADVEEATVVLGFGTGEAGGWLVGDGAVFGLRHDNKFNYSLYQFITNSYPRLRLLSLEYDRGTILFNK